MYGVETENKCNSLSMVSKIFLTRHRELVFYYTEIKFYYTYRDVQPYVSELTKK